MSEPETKASLVVMAPRAPRIAGTPRGGHRRGEKWEPDPALGFRTRTTYSVFRCTFPGTQLTWSCVRARSRFRAGRAPVSAFPVAVAPDATRGAILCWGNQRKRCRPPGGWESATFAAEPCTVSGAPGSCYGRHFRSQVCPGLLIVPFLYVACG